MAQPAGARDPLNPTVALLPWGLTMEDFLEPHGLTLETLCTSFRGSWQFGYVDALRSADVETILIWFSRDARRVSHHVHAPTGARLVVVPVPRVYRMLRSRMSNPYGRNGHGMFGDSPRSSRVSAPLVEALAQVAPYLATPPLALRRVLRGHHCSVILCQEYEFPRFDVCALLARTMRLPLFATFQGGDYQRWRLERLLRPLALRWCSGLVVASRAEADRLRARYQLPLEKLADIPNPIDVSVWHPAGKQAARELLGIPEGVRVVAWHGRTHLWKKGLDVLIAAWIRVCKARDPSLLRLQLVGDGQDADELRALIARSGLDNIVFVNDLVHDQERLRRMLVAADVYAFPSRHEGFAIAPLEAMACGVPVVAADVSGIREVLADGEGGVLVAPGDASALSRALGALLDDGRLAHEVGARARDRVVTAYSYEPVGRRLRSFLTGDPM